MTWDHETTFGLARPGCQLCMGLGLMGMGKPCHCVLRAIFRACFVKFRACAWKEKQMAHVSPEGRQRSMWGMKSEEFLADFMLTAKRALAADPKLYRVFKLHYLLGAPLPTVNAQLGRPPGERETFHDYYRVQQRLGRAFAEMVPYPLWPTDEYFAHRRSPRTARAGALRPVNVARRFPLRQAVSA